MMSYMTYRYPTSGDYDRIIGVLVYPGQNWKTSEVRGFDRPLYLVKMPITDELLMPDIANFIRNIVDGI